MAKSIDTQKANTHAVQHRERNNHACKFKFIRIQLAKSCMIHAWAGFTCVSHILWHVHTSIARLVADHRYLTKWHGVALSNTSDSNATSALVSARLVCVAILAPKLYLYTHYYSNLRSSQQVFGFVSLINQHPIISTYKIILVCQRITQLLQYR